MPIRNQFLVAFAITCFLGCDAQPPAKPTPPSGKATISVAASTKELIESLAKQQEASSGTKITVNAGPTSTLANQLLAGAPVDLFLSANRSWAKKVHEAGLAARRQAMLTNKLVLVVPQGNPAKVQEPADLASKRVMKIALAGENIPAGMYADQALTKLGLLEKLVADGKIARGQDVRSALAYVERGEAEAGIVYATDVPIARGVEVVHEFDPALHDEIAYVLVLTKRGAENPAAEAMFEFLLSPAADAEYTKAGFQRLSPDAAP